MLSRRLWRRLSNEAQEQPLDLDRHRLRVPHSGSDHQLKMEQENDNKVLGDTAPNAGGPGFPLQSSAEDGERISAAIPIAGWLILRHALGLFDDGVPGPNGEFRNHFVTGESTTDYSICEDLVRRELMTRRRYGFDEVNVSWIYRATEAGKAVARDSDRSGNPRPKGEIVT